MKKSWLHKLCTKFMHQTNNGHKKERKKIHYSPFYVLHFFFGLKQKLLLNYGALNFVILELVFNRTVFAPNNIINLIGMTI